MKINALLLLTALTMAPAFAGSREGTTNIGSGGVSSSQYYPADPNPILSWCSERLGIIADIRMQAAMAKQMGSSSLDVVSIYEEGLVQLGYEYGPINRSYSLTHRSIVRGIQMSQDLAVRLGSNELAVATRINFLEKYYRFIEQVAAELDIPYYIPYYNRGGCQNCIPDFSEEAFGNKVVQFARSQMAMVMDALTVRDSLGLVYTRGTPGGYLTVLERVTLNVALDLQSSLMATRSACVVQHLGRLNAKLARHNSGDKTVYGGRSDYAVRSSAIEVQDTLASIDRILFENTCGQSFIDPRSNVITPRRGEGYQYPPYITPRN